MAISFTPITFKNTIDGGPNLDTNFSRIQTALTGALSRTSSTDNEMGVELDMNSNKIINLAEPTAAGDAARLADVQAAISGDTSANLVSFTPYDIISSDNVQGAIQELIDETGSLTVTTETGTQTLVTALNQRATDGELATLRADTLLETNLTVNIPTDYATLQEAVDDLSTLSVKEGVTIDLLIEAGHQPTAGVLVTDRDYGHFQISSIDAEVTLAGTFTSGTDFLSCTNGRAPVLNCLINANGLARYGVNCQQGSYITVNSGCGVKNATDRGIYLNALSYGLASSSIFTGTGSINPGASPRGAWIARGSTLVAELADFSNSAGVGIYVSRASTVHAMDVKAQNCGNEAVWVHRSSRFTAHAVTGAGVLLSNTSGSPFSVVNIARTSVASINADAGSAPVNITQNGTGNGVTCAASLVNINTATISGGATSDDGITCTGGGTVEASNVSVSGFNNNINCNGGTINAPLSSITGARNFGLVASRSDINIAAASVTGSATLDINNVDGSFTRAQSCTTSSGSPALGDTNVPSFNALSARGVIFT